MKNNSGWFRGFTVLGLVMVGIVGLIIIKSGVIRGEATKDGNIKILKSGVTAKAKFYPVSVDGVKMEVVAVKASDGSIRTAFNTCQVCFDSGRGYYIQEGDELVCQNCGNRFQIDKVEKIKNGCNPVPITSNLKTDNGKYILITKSLLVKAKPLFTNWKKG